MKKYYLLAVAITLVACLAVGSNLLITSGRKSDQKITEDLTKIEQKIDKFAQDNDNLPSDLDELSVSNLNNPASEYEYKISDDRKKSEYNDLTTLSYELCATFSKAIKDEFSDDFDDGYGSFGFNYHKAGRHCFELNVIVENYGNDKASSDIDIGTLEDLESFNSSVRQ